MTRTAKRSKKSSWPSWEKQRKVPSFRNKIYWRDTLKMYLPTMIFVSWLGTYLDLILVTNQMYSFPLRPFADLFPFNIFFTLVVLPVVTAVITYVLIRMIVLHKILFILILAFVMTFVEIVSGKMGWFVHSADWQHYYTFIGYILFMWLVYRFHRFIT